MRVETLELVAEAVCAGARRATACAELGLSPRTLERWEAKDGGEDCRHGPKTTPANKLTEKERANVLKAINQPELAELGPHQLVPKLADLGTYLCSEATMYRILKDEDQLAHRGRAKAPREARPVERVATGPNQIWSWDITYLRSPVRGIFLYLYMVVDVWSRKIVGFEVHDREDNDLAAKLIAKAAAREGIEVDTLTLHADNGGPMKGSTMLATLERLGIAASFSRPRVSDDNPYSEALFRTLKYRPNFPDPAFKSLADARAWVGAFVRWYNTEHLHSGVKYVRPIDRHEGRDAAILSAREAVYEAAKAKHPERWGSRSTRNWNPPKRVCVRARRSAEEVTDKQAA